MLQRTIVVGAAAAVLFIASLATAQEQKRSQSRSSLGGFRGGSAGLLAMAEVQKELGISDEQKGLVEDVQADLRKQLFGGNTSQEEFLTLSHQERQKRMEEFRKKSEELNKQADEMIGMLLEPKQSERLNQLRLQSDGPSALGRAEVAEKAGLSADQRAKVRKILDDLEAANQGLLRSLRDVPREERGQVYTKMREQKEKAETDVLGVLTAQEKAAWQKMQGKKFEFPQRGLKDFSGGDRSGTTPKKSG